MPARPKMVLFDYGHTLIYEKSNDKLDGWNAVLQHAVQNPHNVDAEDLLLFEKEWFDPVHRVVMGAEYEMPNICLLRSMFDALELEFDLPIEEFDYMVWDVSCKAEAMPGAEEMLSGLKARGIRRGVISNLPFSQASLSRRIREYIPTSDLEFIIASSDYGFRKPNRILFDIAINRAKLDPSEIWYCGDNSRADVFGSHNAGMFPVWYRSELPCFYRDPELDRAEFSFEHMEIKDWSELLTALDALK